MAGALQEGIDPAGTVLPDGWREIEVATLSGRVHVQYASGSGFPAIELPYAGTTAAMVVLLPNPGSFQEFELGLDRTTLEAVIAAMRATTLVFSIPRFRFGNSFGLSQALSRLGMRKPFAAELANFSGMTGARGLFATELVHQAFIGIEEAGTEAAGASAVALAPSQPGVELPVTIDRPFIFLIRDRESGQILFAGRVLNPAR